MSGMTLAPPPNRATFTVPSTESRDWVTSMLTSGLPGVIVSGAGSQYVVSQGTWNPPGAMCTFDTMVTRAVYDIETVAMLPDAVPVTFDATG